MSKLEDPELAEGLPKPPVRGPLHASNSPRDAEPSADSAAELEAWHRERMERRLLGEYEMAYRKLGRVLDASLDSRTHIAQIRLAGSTNARHSFLDRIIKPYLSLGDYREETLAEVVQRVQKITAILDRADIFSSIEPSLERSRMPTADPQEVDLVLKVRDKSRIFLKGSTEAGDGEGNASATARIRNAFGGAETVESTISFGTRTKRSFQVRMEAPLSSTLLTRGEISAFQFDRDHSSFASCSESVTGAKATIRRPTSLGTHEISYEASLRRLKGLSPAASVSIREAAGQNTKSSIQHVLFRDTRITSRDGRGHWFKVAQELAGFGGDTSHLKAEFETQMIRRPLPSLALSASLRGGALYPLFSQSSHFSDRFQLGGPTSLRMFRHNGIGPKDGDSLGGELMLAGGLSLIGDVPKKPHWPLKLHTFINAGRLTQLSKGEDASLALQRLLSRPSVSVGAGLIYHFNPVRLEVNFGFPIMASKSDSMQRGFQVGLGLDFL